MIPPRTPTRNRMRTLHRALAVVAGGYFLLMAGTGVLLNHRQLLAPVDLPRSWLPGDYVYRDWNRNALRGSVEGRHGDRYWFGEAGVWQVAPGGNPRPLLAGFPGGAYRRDTRALLWVEGPSPHLLAATRNGLFGGAPAGGGPFRWEALPLPAGERDLELVDLVRAGSRVLAVTRSRLYAADVATAWPPRFADVTPSRVEDAAARLPLFRLLFHAHSGEVWGTLGRLLVDATGVLLGLFTASGLWFWWRRRRGRLAAGPGARLCRQGLRWHLRYGLWGAVLLLFVSLTGLFQRPPFLIAVARVTYPPALHPAPHPVNPWHDLLRKAAYDSERDEVVLATDDGFFRGPADGSEPFRRAGSGPPVSVMGATVFRRAPDGLYWVGSMSGLYVWDPASGWVADAFTGRPPVRSFGRPVGDHAVAGLVFSPDGTPLVADYFTGVIDGAGRPVHLPVPDLLADGGHISLWHLLFEIHNGRFFGFLLGWWSWVLVPLGGLALSAEAASGAVVRVRARRRRKRKPGPGTF